MTLFIRMTNIFVIYQASKFNFSVFWLDKGVSRASPENIVSSVLLWLQGQNEYCWPVNNKSKAAMQIHYFFKTGLKLTPMSCCIILLVNTWYTKHPLLNPGENNMFSGLETTKHTVFLGISIYVLIIQFTCMQSFTCKCIKKMETMFQYSILHWNSVVFNAAVSVSATLS